MSNGKQQVIHQDIVNQGMTFAREFVAKTSYTDLQSGQWLSDLFLAVAKTHDTAPVKTSDDPDVNAEELISLTRQYATITGGITGMISANQHNTLQDANGMTKAIWQGTVGVEMVYLTWLESRLVFDIGKLYGKLIPSNDASVFATIFQHVYGVPSDDTQLANISNKIQNRTLIKYTMTGVAVAVGMGYNYIKIDAIGKMAKAYFQHGTDSSPFQSLIEQQHAYDVTLPAAVMYMAMRDGIVREEEKALYDSILRQMSVEGDDKEKFDSLIGTEDHVLEAVAQFKDETISQTLFDMIALMAVVDGELTEEERDFMSKVGISLNIPNDFDTLQARADSFQAENSGADWRDILVNTATSFGELQS